MRAVVELEGVLQGFQDRAQKQGQSKDWSISLQRGDQVLRTNCTGGNPSVFKSREQHLSVVAINPFHCFSLTLLHHRLAQHQAGPL